LIVEDHAIVRDGLKRILSDLPGGVHAGEAATANEGIKAIREGKWDLVLLDLQLPGKSGADALRTIVQEYPKLPVLVLSMFPEEQYAVRMLKAGAAGYLEKDAAPEDLVAAALKVMHGGKVFSDKVAQSLIGELRDGAQRAPHEKLTDREFQVFQRIASGKTSAGIAADLFLSVKTVGTYRARIIKKLGINSTAKMALYAAENGLMV
jgi:two-component system, NarL family, invasion response regulator UvrY